MSDFHLTQMGHRFFSHDVPELIKALKTIGQELTKLNNANESKEAHYKEILNGVIDHVSAGENCRTTISELLKMGFDPNDLVYDFNFSRDDVDDVVNTEDDVEERGDHVA